MVLRQATLQDKKEIINIANLLYLNMPGFVWNEESFIERQIKKGEYFVIEKEGIVAGIMSLRQRKRGMHIETLVVKKEFQLNGFGTKFIEFAKEYSKKKGNNTLYSYSFSAYNMADFYFKKGFKKLDYEGYYNNHKYDCYEMKI